MIVDDLFFLDTSAPIETDVCIVGSGPAGCAIAEELRDSGLRILVLESGGGGPEDDVQALNSVEDVGVPVLNGRERRLGGTSTVWVGRCIPFDEIDYEARPWVPLSGWPLGREALHSHVNRAGEYLGAGPYDAAGRVRRPPGAPPAPAFDPSLLRDVCWEDTAPVDFGRRLLGNANPNLRVLLHATVTHLNTDPETGQLESVEVACAPDRRATVTTSAVVLCAGGVENARILLYSNRTRPAGVGNDHDVVGRYLMDHPRDFELLVRFQPAEAARVRSLFGPRRLASSQGRRDFTFGVALSPECQRRDELLNCAAWPFAFESSEDPMRAARRLLLGPRTELARDARLLLDRRDVLRRALWARLRDQPAAAWRDVEQIGMLVASEQVPDRDSRVCLSERRDPLGLPISRIDWRIGDQERASQAALARLIGREFERLGLPAVELADWVRDDRPQAATFVDGCHPTGTTRMAADPRHGVVDADCQVHGVPGLYVAGSSVFPTAGHANPTLMIVALAVRLAHHLRRSLTPRIEIGRGGPGEESTAVPRPAMPASGPTTSVPAGTTVAVTGATGFIGGRLVERLVDDGAEVVCLVRGASNRSGAPPAGAAVRTVELSDAAAVREALHGVELLFHLAYSWDDEEWNSRALRALIEACRTTGCRRLVHVSSFVVYRIPAAGEVTEETDQVAAAGGYAGTKLQLERELFGAARDGGPAATVVQPTIVYGPGSQAWTRNPADMLHFGTVVLPGAGDGACNAVYVDDVVSAMMLAATRPEAVGERFLISGPRPVTWSRFYEEVAAAIGAGGPQYLPPDSIASRDGRLGKLRELAADPDRLLRRVARTGPGDRLLTLGLEALPQQTADPLRARLHGPDTRVPGRVHQPDAHSRAIVSSEKARRMIGYEPRFDFAAGMLPTARYLAEYARDELDAVASRA